MPWMLQPKSYTQIARPNLYNVAYRRVGTYKGMGRLHPTNYLQIGVRPNQIGATTGQYNTLSGQLSLLPPSLRGLGWRRGFGQTPVVTSTITYPTDQAAQGVDINTLMNLPTTPSPWSTMTGELLLQPGAAGAIPAISGAVPAAPKPTTPTYLPWILGGLVFALLFGGRR